MKPTMTTFTFKDTKLETVEEVWAVLTAILEDIESGDITVSEATQIRDEIKKMRRTLRAQMKNAKPENDVLLKLFYGG